MNTPWYSYGGVLWTTLNFQLSRLNLFSSHLYWISYCHLMALALTWAYELVFRLWHWHQYVFVFSISQHFSASLGCMADALFTPLPKFPTDGMLTVSHSPCRVRGSMFGNQMSSPPGIFRQPHVYWSFWKTQQCDIKWYKCTFDLVVSSPKYQSFGDLHSRTYCPPSCFGQNTAVLTKTSELNKHERWGNGPWSQSFDIKPNSPTWSSAL
jgi:hypothetical protein